MNLHLIVKRIANVKIAPVCKTDTKRRAPSDWANSLPTSDSSVPITLIENLSLSFRLTRQSFFFTYRFLNINITLPIIFIELLYNSQGPVLTSTAVLVIETIIKNPLITIFLNLP